MPRKPTQPPVLKILTPGVVYMSLAVLAFSLMNLSVKALHNRIPIYEIIFFRSIISGAYCFALLRAQKIPVFGSQHKYLILRGISGAASLILFFITISGMPLGASVTIQYLSPIFTAIVAYFIAKEPLRLIQWLFFLISFLGVFLIGGYDENVEWKFIFLGLGSSLCSGFSYNFIRKIKDKEHPLVVIFYFPLISLPIVAPFTFLYGEMPQGFEWFLLIVTGAFTQMGQFCLTKALQLEETSRVTPILYFGVIFALLYGAVFFEEYLAPISLLGIVLVVAGVLLNLFYKAKK